MSKVSAIVLNFNSEAKQLAQCLQSLEKQTYQNIETIVVDNGSSKIDTLKMVEKEFPTAKVVRLERNYGFSGGMNRGISLANGEFVFLLNFDTRVEPEAVEEMLKVITRSDDIVGIAPKMLLSDQPSVIDSVGILVDGGGTFFNQGIGQVDIGQYDEVERTFGACFGAALLRRRAFDSGAVGPLDQSYFMFYEDVDWCYRANLLGYKFFTAPKAVVYHVHSAAAREKSYSFKYRLLERNLFRTYFKDFGTLWAAKRIIRHSLHGVLEMLQGKHIGDTLFVWLNLPIDLVRLLPKRIKIQRRRRVKDKDIIKYSYGEVACFDPRKYSPRFDLQTLEAMYKRLYLVKQDERTFEIYQYLHNLNNSKIQFDSEIVKNKLRWILANEPEPVKRFIEDLQPSKP